MKTVLNILTLGLYSLFSKTKSFKSNTEKTKYRKDGTVKKVLERDVEYTEGEGLTNLPK